MSDDAPELPSLPARTFAKIDMEPDDRFYDMPRFVTRCPLRVRSGQMVAVGGYLLTDNELGMYTVSAAFALGFSGLIPAYIVSVRELFPSSEASWRVPLFMFTAMGGMTVGSWLAGHLYDVFGSYGPAFMVGVLSNLANLALIGTLVMRQRKTPYVLREASA